MIKGNVVRSALSYALILFVGVVLTLIISFFEIARADTVAICPSPGVVFTVSGSAQCVSSVDSSLIDWVSVDYSEGFMPVLSESDGYQISFAILGLWALCYSLNFLKRAVTKR